MDPATVTHECALPDRGAGTDAERRAARALEDELRASGRAVDIEPHWVRPQWALVLALNCALLVAGSVLAVPVPVAGLAVIGVVLAALVLELLGRLQLLRLLTPSRATQNVVSAPSGPERPVLLVIAAGYDAPRGGLAYRAWIQRAWRSFERWGGGRLPGPLAWPVIAGVLLLGVAVARTAGGDGIGIALLQLVGTVVALVAVALLADIALSDYGPGASEAASAGVALALARELADASLRALDVEVVLAGAATGPALGMRAYLRARRDRPRQETIVLGIGPCGRGPVGWARAEGPLLALRYHPRLVELGAQVAHEEAHLRAAPFTARGLPSCAHPARVLGFPSLLVACRPVPPVAPEENELDDLDLAATLDAVDFCVALVAKIDRDVAARYGLGDG